MTKTDLVERVADAIGPGVTKRDCKLVVDGFLVAVKEALARGEVVELRGFGTLKVRHRKARRHGIPGPVSRSRSRHARWRSFDPRDISVAGLTEGITTAWPVGPKSSPPMRTFRIGDRAATDAWRPACGGGWGGGRGPGRGEQDRGGLRPLGPSGSAGVRRWRVWSKYIAWRRRANDGRE